MVGARSISIDLPFPPSVNRTRRMHGAGAARLERWHKLADKLVMATRRDRTRITGPFEATIVMSEAHGLLDLDNGIKAILDYAVRIELIPDDRRKYFRRLVVDWGAAAEGCRLTLRELAP